MKDKENEPHEEARKHNDDAQLLNCTYRYESMANDIISYLGKKGVMFYEVDAILQLVRTKCRLMNNDRSLDD